MSTPVKVVLYAVLVLLAGISGYFAFSSFGQLMSRSADRTSELEQIEPERKQPVEEATTNAPAETNVTATAAAATNALATNDIAASTNQVPSDTNNAVAASSNAPASAPENASTHTTKSKGKASAAGAKKGGHLGISLGVFLVSLLGLGLLIAGDVSHYFGSKALKVIYNDEGDGLQNPDYEAAEQLWANGKHLEAISAMREYLQRNPREQHVAIRIAEIYEKDLKNHLAAALEYEEVLKHKLPPDRWGWAAIHLCNLYFKLSQEQKGFELLRRIVNEYPTTAAAEKARKRLEQVDGASAISEIAGEDREAASPKQPAKAAPSAPTAPSTPPSNLPPGFRPKK